ncbi:hypothetical protein [Caldiplasma sukawensis]
MEEIVKAIIRSWNWPGPSDFDSSDIPTPYLISKRIKVNYIKIKNEWDNLFKIKYVLSLHIVPTSKLSGDGLIAMESDPRLSIQEMENIMENLDYVDRISVMKTYFSKGKFSILKQNTWYTIFRLINHKKEFSEVRERDILSMVPEGWKKMYEFFQIYKIPEIKGSKRNILASVLFEDIYKKSLKGISKEVNKSQKTVKRSLDDFLSLGYIKLAPNFNQEDISGWFIVSAIFHCESIEDMHEIMFKINGSQKLKEHYLTYSLDNIFFEVMFYYENFKTFDLIVEEIKDNFNDFAIFDRIYTSYSKNAKNNLMKIIPTQ